MPIINITVDSYAVLGVSRDADIKEINAVYKQLALKSHPDKTGGTDAATERFREIKDAVETLRDPVRRSQLDRSLNNPKWARCGSEGDETAGAYYGNPYSRKKGRNRRSHRNAAPSPESSRHRNNFDARNDSDYMHSFGNSVHMDPNSAENMARRAQFKAEKDQWEREWQGIDPEMEKLRAEYYEEDMRSRRAGDLDDTAKEAGGGLDDDLFYSPRSDFNVFGTFEKELDAGTDKGGSRPADFMDSPDMEKEFGHILDMNEKDGKHPYWSKSSSSSAGHDSARHSSGRKATYEARSSFDSTNCSSHKRFASCHSTTSSVDKFSTQSHAANTVNATENSVKNTFTGFATSVDISSPLLPIHNDSVDDPSNKDSYINSYLGNCEALKNLVPFFEQKVREHPEQYTADDLYGELNGVVLETYNGWLEGMRMSFRAAKTRNILRNPAACAHLGSWQKELNRAECDRCHLCKPLYVLTCPGCGLKACVRCKFTDAYFADK
ncbi:hypothetical protein N7499_007627 [Penicillium canescens]|nr:hypothetical protein N7499_007627 [Penicillium canescens]KAJ6175448.1 hypothetical protein N7485_002362 [Penicillium canescens]